MDCVAACVQVTHARSDICESCRPALNKLQQQHQEAMSSLRVKLQSEIDVLRDQVQGELDKQKRYYFPCYLPTSMKVMTMLWLRACWARTFVMFVNVL
jgi:hypothetical protein